MTSVKDNAGSRHDRATSLNLGAKLDQAITVLKSCVAAESPLVPRFNALRGRLQHNQLQLAVLGQFKRGKSTFINALLGAPARTRRSEGQERSSRHSWRMPSGQPGVFSTMLLRAGETDHLPLSPI